MGRGVTCMYEYIQKSAEYPIYKHKRISAFLIDETVNQIGNKIFSYGYVLNQFTDLCLESTFLKKEICL